MDGLVAGGKAEHHSIQTELVRSLSKISDANNMCDTGECAHASIAYLRYLTAADPDGSAAKITRALGILKRHRAGDGRWHKFPFFFVLLWLTELPNDLARAELTYAAGRAAGLSTGQEHLPVRQKILDKVLARTNRH
jgi:hypothetical protein